MFAYKGSFEFDWITPIDSLTVIPFYCDKTKQKKNQQKKKTKNINNDCLLNTNKLD